MKTYLTVAVLAMFCGLPRAEAQDAEFDGMSFFVTSEGPGNGGDLGGVEGADQHCQELAESAGAGQRTWRAYLSTQVEQGRGASARFRIGEGPWYNAHGILIASDLNDLHLNNRTITKETAVDEHGNQINGVGDSSNRHDILTGTMADGMAFFSQDICNLVSKENYDCGVDHTCNNWMSSGEGSAMVGHHDRHGGGITSWNSAHQSVGCSQEQLRATGGDGLFYCFAAD